MAILGVLTNGRESERYAPLVVSGNTVVTYRITRKPGMIGSSLTDVDGKFQFPNLAQGRYKVTAPGRTEVVEVRENDTKIVPFRR
jgi:hypothetical protein